MPNRSNLSLAIIAAFPAIAQADVFTVTSTADSGPGTLRQAILDSEANDESDTVLLDIASGTTTISLTSGPLVVSRPQPIFIYDDQRGLGGLAAYVDASGASRLLEVVDGASATVSNIEFTNGSAERGGGIYIGPDSSLSLRSGGVSLSEATGTAVGDGGGGILVEQGHLDTYFGGMTFNTAAGLGGGILCRDCTMSLDYWFVYRNSADFHGGGIHVEGNSQINLDRSYVSMNSSTYGNGGGLSVQNAEGTVISANLTRTLRNTAGLSGGCIFNDGATIVVNRLYPQYCTALGSGQGMGGGALAQRSGSFITTGVYGAVIARNHALGAGASGGAILVTGGTLFLNTASSAFSSAEYAGGVVALSGPDTLARITDTNFRSEVVLSPSGGGGAISVADGARLLLSGGEIRDSTAYRGGAIWNDGGFVTADRVQLRNNTATFGGGLHASSGETVLQRSLLSGNSALDSGGGVSLQAGDLTIGNSTLSGNTADSAGGGLALSDSGFAELEFVTIAMNTASTAGGLSANLGAGAFLGGSIVSENDASDAPNIGGEVFSADFNVIGDITGGQIMGNLDNSVVGVLDAGLLPLADNGGDTMTHALTGTSPAIGRVTHGECPDVDQRGFARNAEACDAGAFAVEVFFRNGFEGTSVD